MLDDSGRKIAYSRLRVVDAEGKELTARMEVTTETRLAVLVDDAAAAYPVRIDPTFSDADWISMGGLPGAERRRVMRRWWMVPAISTLAATSPWWARCWPITSPNGTGARGRPWGRGWEA